MMVCFFSSIPTPNAFKRNDKHKRTEKYRSADLLAAITCWLPGILIKFCCK